MVYTRDELGESQYWTEGGFALELSEALEQWVKRMDAPTDLRSLIWISSGCSRCSERETGEMHGARR